MRWNSNVRVVLVAAVVVVAVAGALRATPSGDEPARAIPTGIVMPGPGEVSELPDPPIGRWNRYNVVPLVDGSGFVVAGAANESEEEQLALDRTLEAAWFRFDTGDYEPLPVLPVEAGLGDAAGARVGSTIVVVGQDCPPGPQASTFGVEFCSVGAVGAKVVLTWSDGDDAWKRHQLPDAMLDFAAMSPTVIGVSPAAGAAGDAGAAGGNTDDASATSTVWLSSRVGGRDRALVGFSPTSSEFGPVLEAPADADQVCVLNSELHAFDIWSSNSLVMGLPPDRNRRWLWNGSTWTDAQPFVEADGVAYVCALDSVFAFVPRGPATLGWLDYVVSVWSLDLGVQPYGDLLVDPLRRSWLKADATASATPLVEIWDWAVDEANQPTPLVDGRSARWAILTSSGPVPIDHERTEVTNRVHSLGRFGLIESIGEERYGLEVVGLSEEQ